MGHLELLLLVPYAVVPQLVEMDLSKLDSEYEDPASIGAAPVDDIVKHTHIINYIYITEQNGCS